jgi:transcriptional regulator with XRE-family HTH domain
LKTEISIRPERLAEKLKQIREKLNLSQNEMLDQLGFKERLFRSNISQYELGTREPSLLVLLAYARLAKISVESLIDDELDFNYVKD